ncbi:MAG TPA: zinc-binding dehydrogenase [Ktedonobacteraceae bacterium]|nr:zinc-binding dehydrogenase [Ktedonobacteraceae bacterium]
MKAVQFDHYGEPDVLQSREVPEPDPGPGDVLVQVKATTVNRLDMFQRNGSRPVEKLPFTPGLEAAGIVLEDSNGFHKGERVMTTRALAAKGGGGYAEIIAVPAQDLVHIPDGVSFQQAVAAGLTSSTAWSGLFDIGHLQPGERVLIWAGASGVGSMAIQLAKDQGCWVATTASNEQKAQELRQLGADLVIFYRQENVGEAVQKAGGVNLVLELVGTTLQESITACLPDGRVVLVGNLGGRESTVDTQTWRLKRVDVLGGGLMHTTVDREQQIMQKIADHRINPVIDRTMPVEQAAEAHRILQSGEPIGKIVLEHS